MTDKTPNANAPREEKPSPRELEQARRDALRLKMTRRKLGVSGRIGRAFLESKLTPLIIVASLLLGAFATHRLLSPALAQRRALTESGSTARWMSRIRSDIPIYALTPHAATSRRVTIYRGVIPVFFGADHSRGGPYRSVFDTLLARNLASVGDYVIVTRGDVEGVSGGTNSMTIVQVTEPG